MKNFNFEDLFVLDLANNHQGDIKHAENIIEKYSSIIKKNKLKATIKFQFRNLETFIHPEHKFSDKNKHIKRFLSTELSIQDYSFLKNQIKKNKLLTCCTPFDEESVEKIEQLDFDIIKIASCSAMDWPLIERISKSSKPVIFSTGGLRIENIDDLVSFFDHKGIDFAIMHCVSIYPTARKLFNLNIIETLKKRYPGITVGWSTHEEPNDFDAIKIAYAKGARMFERHIGDETKDYKLNKYSSLPNQFEKWIQAYKYVIDACGDYNKFNISKDEIISINQLLRGVYAKVNLDKNSKLCKENIFFSMPLNEGQLKSGSFDSGMVLKKNVKQNKPILLKDIKVPPKSTSSIIKDIVHDVKAMLVESKVVLNSDFEVEFSHHYGIENFRRTGAIIINCINRSYCKKIIVVLPGQKHPAHFHPKKEETFQILNGSLDIFLDGKEFKLSAGQTCLIQPGVWHAFESNSGCVFEEISTTHFDNDSVYKDKNINKMARNHRKTIVENWGRFQI